MTGPRRVVAARGTELSCKGWEQEAALRLLMNNLDPEVAERPDQLVVYGGTGKAARNWQAFDDIVTQLRELENDETLLVQSGKPVAVLRTNPWAPRVLLSNAMLVPQWATQDEFDRLESQGLTMFGQMTAGSWAYIGSQGILQSTYETFAAVGRKDFDGTLAGTFTVTAGLGGMGGAQPLAVTMNGGVVLCVEVDEEKIRRRESLGFLECVAKTVDDAIAIAAEAVVDRRPCSIGLAGNAADVLPALLERGVPIDIVTDQTAAHDPLYYVPQGYGAEEAAKMRRTDRQKYLSLARESIVRHVEVMIQFARRGTVVFEYGNGIRAEAQRSGLSDAFQFPGFISAYIRPFFEEARGHCRWIALSGDSRDIDVIDDAVRELLSENDSLDRWLALAREKVPFQGLPARTCLLGYGERHRVGLLINELVRSGRVSAPVAIGREHLDAGSVASPFRETEGMLDGSDAIADWPILNALVNTSSGATWVSVHDGGGVGIGRSVHAGVVVVADGSAAADQKLERVLTNDPATGVIRHADAGYEHAREFAAAHGIGLRNIR